MSSKTSEAIRLPTVAEIEAATELISAPDASAKFVRVNELPVPRVHAAFRNPNTSKTYIMIKYLPGDTLQKNLILMEYSGLKVLTLKSLVPSQIEEHMDLAIIEKLRQTESDPYVRLLQNMINQTLNSHRTVFTHGDLQPKNIMDFGNATIACRFKPDWLELVPDILEQYPVEFLMMQVVYSSVFY
ncbi:hypothetical protein BDV11DRAFT_204326 [Aspergillus similis]